MKEKTRGSTVSVLAEIGIIAALGFVLDELQSAYSRGLFVNGGSIGFAMLCVIIVGYRRGFLPALAVGFIMSGLDVLTGPYIVPGSIGRVILQVGLDYILAYPVVALGCLFKPLFDKAETKGKQAFYLTLGVLVGGLAKFFVHFLAGVLFYNDPETFVWGLGGVNAGVYSMLYNGAFMLPCIGLTLAIALAVFFKAPSLYNDPSAIYRRIAKED